MISLIEDLRTLLEDSVRQRGDETFFDSSTLLDVLWERVAPRVCACDVKRPDHPIDGDRSVPQLCLFDLVGTSHADVTHAPHFDVFDLDGRQCLLPGSADRVESLLCRVDLSYLGPPPVKLEQPERYDAWVAAGCIGRKPAPGETLVLTSDGFFTPNPVRSGWGIVCSLVDSSLSLPGQLVGCLCGDVSALLAPVLAQGIPTDAYSAEVAGLALSAVAVLQFAVNCPVLIRADNVSALEGVQGQVQMRDDPLCRLARCLHAASRAHVGFPLLYQHVYGHTGDYANELADALAKAGARGGTTIGPLRFSPVNTHEELALYQWLPHICLSRSRPQEVPLLRDQVMTWSRGPGICERSPDFAMRPFMRFPRSGSLSQ